MRLFDRISVTYLYLICLVSFYLIWPYYNVFGGLHNSLKYNFQFILLLIPIVFLFPIKFLNYLISSKYSFLILFLFIFLMFDIFFNFPLNKYKIDTYCLFVSILFFLFFFNQLSQRLINLFVLFVLLIWLVISILEFYLRLRAPELFDIVWNELTLQSGLSSSELEVKKIHGLGISTQANITAIFSLLFFSIYYLVKVSLRYKIFYFLLLTSCIGILSFSISLTAIASCAFSILLYYTRKRWSFNLYSSLILVFFLLLFSFPFLFLIGDLFKFSANSETKSDYIFEFFEWPLEFFLANPLLVSLGFCNDISNAPLENRYFNLILTHGLLVFSIIIIVFSRLYSTLFLKSSMGDEDALRFIIFSYLVTSYFHISYLPHITSIILFSVLFVYSVSKSTSSDSFKLYRSSY